jgi:hypothetical protein
MKTIDQKLAFLIAPILFGVVGCSSAPATGKRVAPTIETLVSLTTVTAGRNMHQLPVE